MKRIVPIGAGLAMFIAALFLAGLSQQDASAGPSEGLVLQTVLHESPTAVPTATSTPQPTVTPIAGWTKLQGRGVEIWLPPGSIPLPAEQAPFRGHPLLFAGSVDQFGERTVAVMLLNRLDISPELVPFEVLDGRSARLSAAPKPISLGRYQAYTVLSDDLSSAGQPVRRLLYWIDQGYDHWVIVFTLPSRDTARFLPLFEQSARSFSVLK